MNHQILRSFFEIPRVITNYRTSLRFKLTNLLENKKYGLTSTTSSKSTLKNYKESKIKSWKPNLQREFREKSPINNLILRSSNKIPQPTTNSSVLSFLKVQPTKSPENKQPEKSTETDLFHSNKTHKKAAISREGNRIRREVPKILINHVISRNSSKYCNLQQSPSS